MFGQLGVVLLGKIWGKWLRRKYRRIQGQIGELLGVYVNDVVQLYRIGGGDFSGEIIEQGYSVKQSGGSDSLHASLLYILDVLEVVVVDEE
nr:hypothetical protein CFP56_57302 [Quercus suber]